MRHISFTYNGVAYVVSLDALALVRARREGDDEYKVTLSLTSLDDIHLTLSETDYEHFASRLENILHMLGTVYKIGDYDTYEGTD